MKRNEKIDVLRGWAIILVVFGHCMEYASGHEFFSVNGIYNNRITQCYPEANNRM